MKIIFDYQIFLFQQYGGISRYFYELAKNINQLKGKDSAKIIAGLYANNYLEKSDFVSGFKNEGITSKLFYNRFYNKTDSACISISKLIQILNSCDIYHETYYHSKLQVPKKAALVTTIHDMIYEKYSDQFTNAKLLIDDKKRSIFNAQHIIAVSEATKKDVIDIYNISPDKITVVYHGVSLFTNAKKTNANGDPSFKKPFLLYVGLRERYKNARLLMEVYAADKELQNKFDLVFFGGGNETESEREFSRSNKISENAHYLKGNDNLLEFLYKNAFAFIYPSSEEGFGMPCLEAMQYGCPVIAGNTPAIVEAAGSAASFFNTNNTNDLAGKINELINTSSTRQNFINLGKERVKEFTWKKTAENTLAAYSKCLHG